MDHPDFIVCDLENYIDLKINIAFISATVMSLLPPSGRLLLPAVKIPSLYLSYFPLQRPGHSEKDKNKTTCVLNEDLPRSAWTSAQSDQSLRCHTEEPIRSKLGFTGLMSSLKKV